MKKEDMQPKNPKILFVTNAKEFGGAEVYLIYILNYLKSIGIEFALACPYSGSFYKRVMNEGIKTYDLDFGTGFGKWRGLSVLSPITYFQFKVFFSRFKPIIDKEKPDLIHVQQDFKEKLFTTLAANKLGLKVVWTEHGMLHVWIKSTPFRYLYRYAANKYASKVICVSNAVKQDLIDVGVEAKNLVVVHNGIPMPLEELSTVNLRAEFGLADEDIVICSTARLYNKKGIQDLVKAVALVKNDIPNLKVLIVGEGRYRRKIEALIKELQMLDKVVLTGFRKDSVNLVSLCDIFVSSTFDRTEGLPLRILEAMALSKPVIATDISGTKESIEDGKTGFLVPPRDIKSIANAIKTLANDKGLRKKMGEAGKALYLEKFQAERMCSETYGLLNSITN